MPGKRKGLTLLLRLCEDIRRPDVDTTQENHKEDDSIQELCQYIEQLEKLIALIIRRVR